MGLMGLHPPAQCQRYNMIINCLLLRDALDIYGTTSLSTMRSKILYSIRYIYYWQIRWNTFYVFKFFHINY